MLIVRLPSLSFFEVFTQDIDENEAIKLITSYGNIDNLKTEFKEGVKHAIGKKGTSFIKKMLK